MEAAIEAVLFVSGEPVPRGRMLGLFEEAEREEAEAALEAVIGRYAGEGEGRGVMVDEVAGGLRLVTRPELHDWLRRFFDSGGATKLSMAALETLAIVAYHQPVTAPEIQELRGVNPSGVLKTLLERRLIRISGRKEVVGKPFLYCTTREFLVHFGLDDLRDLPPLEEFEELFGDEAGGAAAPAPDRDEQFYREVAALQDQEDQEDREGHEDGPSPGGGDRRPEMAGASGGAGGSGGGDAP
jgi:segregation and condensation protein B